MPPAMAKLNWLHNCITLAYKFYFPDWNCVGAFSGTFACKQGQGVGVDLDFCQSKTKAQYHHINQSTCSICQSL
jgi:hypothetical protein